MRDTTEIHLFTGGKGGVGKTLVALCAAAYFLSWRGRTLVVDLNFNNYDLFMVLKRLAADMQGNLAQDDFMLVPIAENSLLVVPDFTVAKNFQLPLGIAGFYNDYLNKVLGLPAVQTLAPRVCLVDTGFHIANLALPGNPTGDESWLGQDANGQRLPNFLATNKLLIWFVWSLGAWERPKETEIILNAVAQIKTLGLGQFDEDLNLRHVFNPFALYPEPSWTDVFKRSRHPLYKMVSDKEYDPPITLSQIAQLVSTRIRNHRNQGHLTRETYPRLVAEAILTPPRVKRPINFFPLLTYSRLKNYLSDVTYDDPISLADLIDSLGASYLLIEKYLKPYERGR